jgi:hypothetical protein
MAPAAAQEPYQTALEQLSAVLGWTRLCTSPLHLLDGYHPEYCHIMLHTPVVVLLHRLQLRSGSALIIQGKFFHKFYYRCVHFAKSS